MARALGGSEWRGGGIIDAADISTLRRVGVERLGGRHTLHLNVYFEDGARRPFSFPHRLDGGHAFLVLGTDGVWGPLDSAGDACAERSEAVVRGGDLSFRTAGTLTYALWLELALTRVRSTPSAGSSPAVAALARWRRTWCGARSARAVQTTRAVLCWC